ncbi:MocR-like pyridoxine biosynthesis transcription factor PdxR [Arachidicoccus terrestris]|uniref:MocR-like pyridoxine biosynthesis transcription factor PdxR n=1 Tax=Arachidicoccus terrestris TaxID=2875539 RepID=UPI001CC661A7|nr:PLP-dependent aminotransferase family protein [Arachidicoccus terrestris]UAY56003.1 PLP-dependent aminotransferase family protein [Arachidicoccus terrestris]
MIKKLLEISFKKGEMHSPLYLQLESEIIQLICNGQLKPGQMLPSSRELAQSLQLNRKTVVATYEELNLQGWVESRPRSGIYVSSKLPDTSANIKKTKNKNTARPLHPGFPLKYHSASLQNDAIDRSRKSFDESPVKYQIDDGFPDPRLAPMEALAREYRRFGKGRFSNKYLMYGPEHGSLRLRMELVSFLNRTRGMQVSEKEILITKGTQMALYLSSQLLVQPGDTVMVPEPGYIDANRTFAFAGANLIYIPVDKDGMDIDVIEKHCKKKVPKIIYVIPHHHRPTTVTLNAERRMRLLNLADKYHFALIEDDYDFDYHYASTPLFPLASIDTGGHIIYVGSFCKSIAPGIRIGFMVAPQTVIDRAAALRRLIDRQGEQLIEEALAELFHTGDIIRHIKKSYKTYLERLDTTCDLLQKNLGQFLTFDRPQGGLAIWARYKGEISARKVAQEALQTGLKISDGTNYFFHHKTNQPDNFVRIGYCSLNPQEMESAIGLWKQALTRST